MYSIIMIMILLLLLLVVVVVVAAAAAAAAVVVVAIALKSAIRDSCNLLTALRTVSNMLAQVALGAIVCSKSSATHPAPIT